MAIAAAVIGIGAASASAQQPNPRPAPWSPELGPPAPILGLTDARPILPLEFSRAWLGKVESVRQRREELMAEGLLDGMGPDERVRQGAALTGTLRVPVIPIRYADVPVPFHHDVLQHRLFGANVGDTVSFSGYWSEVSGGMLRVEGRVAPWVTLKRPARHYLPAEQHGWSSFGRISELREEVLAAVDKLVDFSQFDNDGPDGVPNSGDDDGYVDFVAILYALPCNGDTKAGAIWPHRAAMAPFETSSIGANGRPIRVADYVILPALDPDTCSPLHIGVLAHETGHALGLPDLYDYDGSSQGIGSWGLMGTGSHSAQYSPSHLGAWEKEQLGWVTVSWLSEIDRTLRFPPVQESGTIYRFDGERGEYLLFENRQRIGSDRNLPGSGLLVWRVDPERAELGAWNNDERRAAVSIIQADGRNDLSRGLRADSGDPFPGRTRQDWFRTHIGNGLQLTGIEPVGDDMRAHAVTGHPYAALIPTPDALRMTALQHGGPVRQTITVRRTASADQRWEPRASAGWLELERIGDNLVLTADPAGLAPGSYLETIDLVDGAGNPLARIALDFYLATPGVGQIVATELPWSWGVAVRAGRILQASYGWDQLGLRPRPRVLELWEGASHPETLARLPADALYSPIVDRSDGAIFVLARAADGNFLYQVRANGDAQIVASHIGDRPAYGAAVMPDGSIAVAEWHGQISRVHRDGSVHPWMNVGTNVYQIATDEHGSLYGATLHGDVLRISPDGNRRTIETGFGHGRLVAIATTADGDVLAAERGGQGRILRVRPDGSRDLVYRNPGALFYGLAVDDDFLFALDLKGRQLLRIPLPTAGSPAIVADGAAQQ